MWKNFVEPSDVNNDQNVSALDALTVINELGRPSHSDDLTSELNDAAILVTGKVTSTIRTVMENAQHWMHFV